MNKGNKEILDIALPSIISNITVPLLGLIDVAIVGHLGSASYIGAIAVGSMIFNIIYWLFGFLRMGTSGMTSQAFGANDSQETARLLVRSCGVGLIAATMLILMQYPIKELSFILIQTTSEIYELTSRYFNICIWGAPAVLGLYSISGWFIGMQNSRYPMYIAITQNIVNILASLLFVYGCGMKIEGVAFGTLIAQYAGFIMACLLWKHQYGTLLPHLHLKALTNQQAMSKFFQINRDIFFRTLCLIAVTTYFTSAGAKQGDIILAVNILLMQLFTIYSYFMDGFAYAGEALTGKYIGADQHDGLRKMIKRLFQWGIGIALAFTLIYAFSGEIFLQLLTNDQSVILASKEYFFWAILIPIAGYSAFL
ncbi:MAG: MATE family efflux transporter, partial [Bacteroidaceae bacterium]|nr:MATE family efflux transporter [Bacteroidaceae bacterium]